MKVSAAYETIVKNLQLISKIGMKLNLTRIKKLLFLLNNPEKKIKMIHVAGTNGKGSICTMYSSIFSHNGYKTGLFVSPYVTDFRESFQINGQMIPKTKFVKIYQKISDYFEIFEKSGDSLTNFEILTAIAFEYFYSENCDIAVIETGLGGTFDSTNVIEMPLLSVISAISIDHAEILGGTLEKIALSKCGIIKKNCPVIVHPKQKDCVNTTILKYSKKIGSDVIFSNTKNICMISTNLIEKTIFLYKKMKFVLPLLGEHQLENVATVFAGLEILNKKFNLTYQGIFDGLKNVICPARLEILQDSPFIILDGAHNFQSFFALADFLKKYLPNYDLIGIVSMLADKEVEKCLKYILPKFKLIFPLAMDCERAMPLGILTKIAQKTHSNVVSCKNFNVAIEFAKNIAAKNADHTAIIIFGSFYLGRIALKTLKNSGNSWHKQ